MTPIERLADDLDVSTEELLRTVALLPLVCIVVTGIWLACLFVAAVMS